MVRGPEIDVDGVEDCEEREAPRDAIDDNLFTSIEELVDDSAEQQQVDE